MLKTMIEQAIKDILMGEDQAQKVDGCESPQDYSGRMIVVLDKGFIHYGNVRVEGGRIIGEDGGQIRYYNEPDGGLPHLCSHSPSEKTKLDKCESWSAPLDRVVSTYQIQEGGI
jgi:hypothetical protein